MKHSIFALISLFILLSSAHAQKPRNPLNTEPIKIMPLGNSITQEANPGFRGYLYKGLVDSGIDIDFVGSLHNMPSNGGDPDHSGFGGFVIGPGPSGGDDWDKYKHGDILYHLDSGYNVMGNGADIILLEIGINDFSNDRDDYNPATVGADRLDSLIQKIYKINSKVILMVANITPVGWDPNFASLFNSEVPIIVNRYKSMGYECYLVDLRNGIEWDMQKDIKDDLLHPTASGSEKIANKFLQELIPVIDSINHNWTDASFNSTENSNEPKVTVYPNPISGGSFIIQTEGITDPFDIRIFNLAGVLVYASYQNKSKQLELPANTLGNAGIFALEVNSLGRIFTQQFIAE